MATMSASPAPNSVHCRLLKLNTKKTAAAAASASTVSAVQAVICLFCGALGCCAPPDGLSGTSAPGPRGFG